jgi:hypothetical protein
MQRNKANRTVAAGDTRRAKLSIVALYSSFEVLCLNLISTAIHEVASGALAQADPLEPLHVRLPRNRAMALQLRRSTHSARCPA